jgi:nucleotidyltransferase substrate binding protein (TIGR01987 family)
MEQLTENLQKKYKKAMDALATLKDAIESMKDVNAIAKFKNEYPDKIYRIFRDSLIQRFEYTFDLTWKYLSLYLESEGRKVEIKTPKGTFREGLKAMLLSEDEARLAIQMVDHRNLSTHGYDEMLIESISAQIPAYCKLIENILQKTSVLSC